MKRTELKNLLDGMDIPHAEVIHGYLHFELINASLPLLIGKENVDPYWTLCDRFFKEKDETVLPEMNEECLKILDLIEEEKGQGRVPELYGEDTLQTIIGLANKPVKTFTASLKDEMSNVFEKAVQTDDIEEAFMLLSPIVVKMADQVQNGSYDEAAGNMLAFFSGLSSIKKQHEEWFEHMLHAGKVSDMVYLTDAVAAVYCHLRQRDDLPKELGEDMNLQLLLLNEQTGIFGDWTLSLYADMLYTEEYQSEDYSNLDDCEIWEEFKIVTSPQHSQKTS